MEEKDRKPEQDIEHDDKRSIANMNIEGMPWYTPAKPLYPESKEPIPPLTGKELWKLTFSATVAALLVAFVFIGLCFLFIQFCIHVWF